MTDREELELLFVDNLAAIDRAVSALCRRYGIATDEIEDVGSWIKARFVESDYAALRQFRGESSLSTYLTVVAAMHFRDYRAQRWGRWRPSAAAHRHGPAAVRLETLVVRDRIPLRQAGEMLRSAGETDMTDRQLAELLGQLPSREPLRPVEVGADALLARKAPGGADAGLWSAENDAERRQLLQQLETALEHLPPEDQVMLRLRYWEGVSIANIARILGVEQKPLYRRLERALRELKTRLERAGVYPSALALLDDVSEPEVA
jgi:RNA polymerase sigma factor (sigma-70 family)